MRNKKAIGDAYIMIISFFLIVLSLLMIFGVTQIISKAKLDLNVRTLTHLENGLFLLTYLRTPVEHDNQNITMAELISLYEVGVHTRTNIDALNTTFTKASENIINGYVHSGIGPGKQYSVVITGGGFGTKQIGQVPQYTKATPLTLPSAVDPKKDISVTLYVK